MNDAVSTGPHPEGDGAGANARLARLLAMQETLAEVAQRIGAAADLDFVLGVVLDAMADIVDFKGGSICLVEGDLVRLASSRPEVSKDVLEARLRIGQGLSGWIVAHGEPVLSRDIRDDPQAALQNVGSNASIRSYLGVPLICSGTVIGLLQVDSSTVGAFDEDDLVLLRGLAVQVAGAIESARRQEELIRLQQLKTDFVARVSHELRTPVTVIAGFASTLVDHGDQLSRDQLEGFSLRMLNASRRLSRLVDEVVALSSLDSGLRQLHPEEVHVHDAVTDLLIQHRVGVRDELPRDLVGHTDRLVLRHALTPLLDNARRYAHDAWITGHRADSRLVIDVVDTGPGIPQDRRRDLFERFTRGEHAQAGMGLGLAIADSVAGTAGGRVIYEPAGGGSRFRLVLPDLDGPHDDVPEVLDVTAHEVDQGSP